MIRQSLAVLMAGALLSGCVTLLPKADPAGLYRLAIDVTPAARAPAAQVIDVLRGPLEFPRMSSGDRIMTVNGSETAAIAGARWVAPAQLMFDEALVSAFDGSSRLRLSVRGGPPAPTRLLRVEVRTFEARYLAGVEAAPTVVIEMRAVLTTLSGTTAVSEQTFRVEKPASENRVGPIVEAYDAATTEALTGLVTWAETAAVTP